MHLRAAPRVDRHDVLRTAVLWEDLPEPRQVVWRRAPLSVDEVAADEVGRVRWIDVRRAPLLRLTVAEDGPRVLLGLHLHHLVGDHGALEVVQREVAAHVRGEEADLPDVEAAALLHDIGQVGLTRPIPRGATVEVSALDQRRIAATGAAILARTADLSRLASVVADVGALHHRAVERGDVALPARVVRVVSAYDDLTGAGADRARALASR